MRRSASAVRRRRPAGPSGARRDASGSTRCARAARPAPVPWHGCTAGALVAGVRHSVGKRVTKLPTRSAARSPAGARRNDRFRISPSCDRIHPASISDSVRKTAALVRRSRRRRSPSDPPAVTAGAPARCSPAHGGRRAPTFEKGAVRRERRRSLSGERPEGTMTLTNEPSCRAPGRRGRAFRHGIRLARTRASSQSDRRRRRTRRLSRWASARSCPRRRLQHVGEAALLLLRRRLTGRVVASTTPCPIFISLFRCARSSRYFEKLKASIQKCVETENDAGVLNLLDQVVEVKKAEQLFKEAREIIATVQW